MSEIYVTGSLRALDDVYLEALCLIEALLRLELGVPVSIVATQIKDPKTALLKERVKVEDVCLCVRAADETRDFTLAVGPIGCTREEFPQCWEYAVQTLKASTAEESGKLWQKSRVANLLPTLVQTLRSKGFEVRR